MEKEFIITLELVFLDSNIKKEICGVLELFSFLRKYEKKFHNMLSLMLDHRFKNLHIASSFIGPQQGKAIVEEYDRKTLYPMLLKCFHVICTPCLKLPLLTNVWMEIAVCTFKNDSKHK